MLIRACRGLDFGSSECSVGKDYARRASGLRVPIKLSLKKNTSQYQNIQRTPKMNIKKINDPIKNEVQS